METFARTTIDSFTMMPCSCGGDKSVTHLVFCPLVRERLAASGHRRGLGTLVFLLSSARGSKHFSSLLEKSKFLTEICPIRAA